MMTQPTSASAVQQRKPRRRPVALFFLALMAIVGAAIFAGVMPRLTRQKGLLAASEALSERKPVVIVSAVHFAVNKDTIDLPADLQPIIEAPIFARAKMG